MKKIIPQIVFKSVLQPIKNIEKRNEYFNSLSDEGKRLEIAWDCLQLICKGTVKGHGGGYWSKEIFFIKEDDTTSFQKTLIDELPACKVCARGGTMLSQIRLGNSIGSNDSDRCSGNYHSIKGFKTHRFLYMENEYETGDYNHPYDCGTTEKLANMCCNILVNGNFNTKDETNYLKIK